MNFGIIVFPGSNCDHDCYHVAKHVLREDASYVWHKDRDLDGFDCVVVPGGFSYGDYLRTGAIASSSPIVDSLKDFAARGGLVIGICNGFQILTEARLLPGALLRNEGRKFICEFTDIRVENGDTPFTSNYIRGDILDIPIAHADGNYFADDETLKGLEDNGQVLFRYVTPEGEATAEANPNGSLNNIAGIVNRGGNVVGMMPHPERASENELGSTSGIGIFESILNSCT